MSIGHDEYGRRIAEAYEAGAKRERKRIAAWLRERAAYCEARGDMDSAHLYRAAADAIREGQHAEGHTDD